MIAIINRTEPPTETGVNKYTLQINDKVLLEFEHLREDPLSVCLRKAADAYDVKFRGMVQFGTGHEKTFEEGVDLVMTKLFPK